MALRVQNAKFTYGLANIFVDGTGTRMPEYEVKEQRAIANKDLKEEIVAMEVLKQADKMRYGNIHIGL